VITITRPCKRCKPLLLRLTLALVVCFSLTPSFSQTKLDSLLGKLDPQKFAASVAQSSKKLEEKLVAKSMKVLDKMQRQEEKIYRKLLSTKDSASARLKLVELKEKYAALKNPAIAQQYIPTLDSLSTSLKFLDQSGVGGKVKDALARTAKLQDKFQQAEAIKKFIKERKEQLKQQLEKLGMVKELKKINKQVYYYAAQVKEYKEILSDPKKIEKKALELLSKTKLFKDFMKKNSMLASIFRISPDPVDPNNLASLSGLQTRVQLNNLIQQQISSAGPGGREQFQQNIQAAQSQLNALKDKVFKAGGGSSDDELPDFKPNTQKTKSFLQRLEYGANIQSQKASYFFPSTSEVGLSLGYKLNDKSIVGVGASYKMGLGRGWNNLRLSHEGIGVRTYADIKLKGSFWFSGGYEMNYRSTFNDFNELRDRNAWQKSGLVGFSKVVSLKTKFFKKTKLMLLWDFLSYEQVPRTQPVVFRVGYSF
jgi:hypothetical protein